MMATNRVKEEVGWRLAREWRKFNSFCPLNQEEKIELNRFKIKEEIWLKV